MTARVLPSRRYRVLVRCCSRRTNPGRPVEWQVTAPDGTLVARARARTDGDAQRLAHDAITRHRATR